MTALVAIAHPDRLSARLDPRLTLGTVERLRSCERLRDRLDALLVRPETSGAASGSAAPVEVAEAAAAWGARLSEHDPRRIATLAGAAWHARSLKLVISGPAVVAIVETIGSEAHGFALRNADVAVDDAAAPAAPDPAELVARIESDGLRCLGLFLLRLQAAVRDEVLVRLPPRSAAERPDGDPSASAAAAVIMARVLAELDRPGAEADDGS